LTGQNGEVLTWGSDRKQTISLRQGILVATRGYGPDLMSAEVPGLAQIATGAGSTQRRHFYLDGADQRQVLEFSCTLSSPGSEEIEILGLALVARKVTESCAGPGGSFDNLYWFDAGQHLVQSSQLMIPGLKNLLVQQVTD
jgi:Group 4 capsule polysaccharide lipoprotein gfcB, YjbF